MKLSFTLTARLFAAVFSTAMAVALAMGVFSHINLNRDFIGYLNEQGVNRLELARTSVTAGYRENGRSWDFLREKPELWGRLLRPLVPEADMPAVKQGPAELTGATRRFTLFDENHERVAGYAGPVEPTVERPIIVDGLTVGWLALTPIESVSPGAEKHFYDAQLRSAWVVGGAAVLLAGAVAFWISRRLLSPVRRVADATHRLAAGDFEVRVPETRNNDDIASLGRDFNQLALTLQRNEAMRREFLADVSHELRTPLGVLHGELEALEDGVRKLDAQALRSLQGEVGILHKLVDDLHELSMADVGALAYRKSEVDLCQLIDVTAGAFGERLHGSGLRLQLDLPEQPLRVFGDERRLRQLLGNLVENSCRYTDAGGALSISARRSGEHAVIDVQDTSPGVGPEHLPRLFERFFRVDASRSRRGGGSGLGLSICQRIAEAHEGRIEARPSPLGGLWMRVELPVHA
ncbi:ATP-binding protein [Mitsuaria sp. CC2]|jgi:two-component system, OmpR family, sensor histidine kinase BaeS|uniref:ATP-binding protein n=1 Tax=Mitsuaria sp. CC2 TaxID=3029186 RepID=UPI001213F1D4|nr:MAG: HAMP domain-containing protein [Rubrivivax sp.]